MQESVHRASASSAPGPNGIPYWVYKGAADVLKYSWRLITVSVEKDSYSKAMAE